MRPEEQYQPYALEPRCLPAIRSWEAISPHKEKLLYFTDRGWSAHGNLFELGIFAVTPSIVIWELKRMLIDRNGLSNRPDGHSCVRIGVVGIGLLRPLEPLLAG